LFSALILLSALTRGPVVGPKAGRLMPSALKRNVGAVQSKATKRVACTVQVRPRTHATFQSVQWLVLVKGRFGSHRASFFCASNCSPRTTAFIGLLLALAKSESQ